MKSIKVMMMALMMCLFVNMAIGQTKVVEEVKVKTELKTFNFEFSNGYYVNTLYTGYQYPSIRSGFYSVGFFLRYEDLVKLYEELITVSEAEDGEYKLTIRTKDIISFKKKGNKILMKTLFYSSTNYSPYHYYKYKITTKYLKEDLQIVKTTLKGFNNK